MDTDHLLQIARDIIAKVPSCLAITVDQHGDANARVVNPRPLSEGWTVRFATHLKSRKCREIEQSGRLTLAYQHDAEAAYVALVGHAVVTHDLAAKVSTWRPDSYRWYPGGPADPNVVYIDFTAERIEIWSSSRGVTPDPTKGLWAAVLVRDGSGWHQQTTLPQHAGPPEQGRS